MLNCEEVSRLVSESLDRRLTFWTRMNLWMHFGMCRLCWRFRKDLRHLHEETHQHVGEMSEAMIDPDVKLPAESAARIKCLLESRDV